MQVVWLGAGLDKHQRHPLAIYKPGRKFYSWDRQGKPLDVDYHYFDVGSGDAVSAATEQAQDLRSKIGLCGRIGKYVDLTYVGKLVRNTRLRRRDHPADVE